MRYQLLRGVAARTCKGVPHLLRDALIMAVIFPFLLMIFFLSGCAEKTQVFQVEDMKIEVATNPSTPKVGDNALSIKLVDSMGMPIKNAMIHINYSMPAMGGMPGMFGETGTELHHDAYHAGLPLSMDGTWNLKVEIHIPDKPHMTLDFTVTTGIKKITLKSGTSKSMGTEESQNMEGMVSVSKEEANIIGVETSSAIFRNLVKEIKTVGTVAYDPDLYVAQEEFVSALKLKDEDLLSASKKRLLLLGMSNSQIEAFEKSGKGESNLILPEDTAFVYATIYEYEYGLIKEGQKVEIESQSYPGVKFYGKIVSIPQVLDSMTRSVKVKIEVENITQKLKPEMFVNVTLKINLGKKLSVPEEAVINTGERSVVVVTDNQGNYNSLDVKVGEKVQGYYEIIGGLKEGSKVVTAGNFLIDSESRLRSALKGGHNH